MANRKRPKIRRKLKLKRVLILVIMALILGAACCGAKKLLVYGGRFFGAGEEVVKGEEADPNLTEDPDSNPSREEPDPEDDDPEGTEPVFNPKGPENIYLVADGDYLMALVTKQTTLGKYAPRDLVALPDEICRTWKYYLREEAADHLQQLWEAAREEGLDLKVVSAYRSYETQAELFAGYASRYGEEQANLCSARPGQSEHQLGTTVDFGGTENDFQSSFAETPQGQWLAEHAYEFGFVMSYPRGSEEITGYIYEPWHFRYIGVEEALSWKASGEVPCDFLLHYRQQLTLMPSQS